VEARRARARTDFIFIRRRGGFEGKGERREGDEMVGVERRERERS
jgi:hypothetical protein